MAGSKLGAGGAARRVSWISRPAGLVVGMPRAVRSWARSWAAKRSSVPSEAGEEAEGRGERAGVDLTRQGDEGGGGLGYGGGAGGESECQGKGQERDRSEGGHMPR